MKQSAAERPDPTAQRKAAIAVAALEHTGKVRIEPISNFDLDRTIFKTLEGEPLTMSAEDLRTRRDSRQGISTSTNEPVVTRSSAA